MHFSEGQEYFAIHFYYYYSLCYSITLSALITYLQGVCNSALSTRHMYCTRRWQIFCVLASGWWLHSKPHLSQQAALEGRREFWLVETTGRVCQGCWCTADLPWSVCCFWCRQGCQAHITTPHEANFQQQRQEQWQEAQAFCEAYKGPWAERKLGTGDSLLERLAWGTTDLPALVGCPTDTTCSPQDLVAIKSFLPVPEHAVHMDPPQVVLPFKALLSPAGLFFHGWGSTVYGLSHVILSIVLLPWPMANLALIKSAALFLRCSV